MPGEEDMGEVPCMDKACLGAVLVSRMRDGISKDAEVSVHVVDVGGLRGRGLPGRLGNGHDGATRLRHDKEVRRKVWAQDGRSTYQRPQ